MLFFCESLEIFLAISVNKRVVLFKIIIIKLKLSYLLNIIPNLINELTF